MSQEPMLLPLLLILGAILLSPFVTRLLTHLLPILRARLGAATLAISAATRDIFRRAQSFLPHEGQLPVAQTIEQLAGSSIDMVTFAVCVVADLQLTLLTLGPLFGVEINTNLFGQFEYLLGFSIVLLATVWGLRMSDLLGWTKTTHFATIEQTRIVAFFLAGLNFLATLAVGVALALYRIEAMQADDAALVASTTLSLNTLSGDIILALAILLVLGAFVTYMGLKVFLAALVALTMVISGVLLSVLTLVLRLLDVMLELTLSTVTVLAEQFAPWSTAAKNSTHGFSTWVGDGLKAGRKRLHGLVYSSTPYTSGASKPRYEG